MPNQVYGYIYAPPPVSCQEYIPFNGLTAHAQTPIAMMKPSGGTALASFP